MKCIEQHVRILHSNIQGERCFSKRQDFYTEFNFARKKNPERCHNISLFIRKDEGGQMV